MWRKIFNCLYSVQLALIAVSYSILDPCISVERNSLCIRVWLVEMRGLPSVACHARIAMSLSARMLHTIFLKNLIVMCDFFYLLQFILTTCLVQWLPRLTAIREVLGSIPGYTLEIFLAIQGLDQGPPSLVRTIGQLLDMRSSEIRFKTEIRVEG